MARDLSLRFPLLATAGSNNVAVLADDSNGNVIVINRAGI
jgi:hypothetical protein